MADERHLEWITAELRRAAETERAPSHLRLAIDEMSRSSRASRRRPSRRFALIPAVGVIAALVLVLILALPGSAPGGPTVAQAAALGARAGGYPAQTITSPDDVYVDSFRSVPHVHLPAWTINGSWTVVGERTDVLSGRRIVTIDYSRNGQVIAYSIAASPLLRGQRSGFTSFGLGHRTVVSWKEADHSCLLSSRSVSRTSLVKLAQS